MGFARAQPILRSLLERLEISFTRCRIEMPKLESNTQLYQYLVALADLLRGTSAAPLTADLEFAAGQAIGLSTEFLGESLIALKKVRDGENGALTNSDREELRNVISQIEFAFKR